MKFREYLKNEGYRLFLGTVDAQVYDYFDCPRPKKAVWFHKEGSYQCAGCRQQCETDQPVGFQIFLDISL